MFADYRLVNYQLVKYLQDWALNEGEGEINGAYIPEAGALILELHLGPILEDVFGPLLLLYRDELECLPLPVTSTLV